MSVLAAMKMRAPTSASRSPIPLSIRAYCICNQRSHEGKISFVLTCLRGSVRSRSPTSKRYPIIARKSMHMLRHRREITLFTFGRVNDDLAARFRVRETREVREIGCCPNAELYEIRNRRRDQARRVCGREETMRATVS